MGFAAVIAACWILFANFVAAGIYNNMNILDIIEEYNMLI